MHYKLTDLIVYYICVAVSSKAVITATTAKLGSKELHLKSNIDKVLAGNNLNVQHVFVSSSPESQLRKLIAPCSSTSEEPFILPVKMHKRDINLMEVSSVRYLVFTSEVSKSLTLSLLNIPGWFQELWRQKQRHLIKPHMFDLYMAWMVRDSFQIKNKLA